MKKILFISHDASRTGAPMVLLHLLRWLQEHQTEIQADLLVLKRGGLVAEFKKVTHNYYDYEALCQPQKLNIKQRILLKLGCFKRPNLQENLFLDLSKNSYDVIYANTIISVPYVCDLLAKMKNTKTIVHLHELNTIIKLLLPDFDKYATVINQYITPAQMVKQNLITNWGVPEHKVEVIYECAQIQTLLEINSNKSKEFVIGASGTVNWRKGQDVFIQLARYLCKFHPEISFKFVWVGRISREEKYIIEEDLEKLGLADTVSFIGEVENPAVHYSDFDVFVMTSREDPFPLVCIEVGMMGKPIVSFKKAVGTNEVLEKAGGFMVPYLDIEAMADKVIQYYKNPDLKKEHGAMNKTAFNQFTPELICPSLFSVIQKHF